MGKPFSKNHDLILAQPSPRARTYHWKPRSRLQEWPSLGQTTRAPSDRSRLLSSGNLDRAVHGSTAKRTHGGLGWKPSSILLRLSGGAIRQCALRQPQPSWPHPQRAGLERSRCPGAPPSFGPSDYPTSPVVRLATTRREHSTMASPQQPPPTSPPAPPPPAPPAPE